MNNIAVGIATILRTYSDREGPHQDTWSPLHNDTELWHRVRLLLETCWMVRKIPVPVASLKVLDVGCGVGRSTRLLVDLGVNPRNLVGIDFRQTAIQFAHETNPAITFRHIVDLEDWPQEQFDLAVQCTAFSSIPGNALRKKSATLMERSVGENGYILWWDILSANQFAGGDRLDPAKLFSTRRLLALKNVSLHPDPEDCIRPLRGLGPRLALAIRRLCFRPTHCIALFGPPGLKE
jgi:SAM-dependent methyltransferase